MHKRHHIHHLHSTSAFTLALAFTFAFFCTQAAFAAPVVSITAPANNTKFMPPAAITLTATASDSVSTISKVDFYNGTTLLGTSSAEPYTFTWNNVSTGKYAIRAKATNASNITTTSSAINLIIDTPPVVTLTSPANAASFAGIATVTLTADASDADGTVTKVDFYRGGTLIGTSTTPPYTATWANIQPGKYSLTARATDNLGAVTTSAPATITVTNPITVAITTPTANAKYMSPATITLAANASDVNGTISTVDFYNGATLIGTATAAPYTVNWSNIPTGKYTITAKATDNQGLIKTSSGIHIVVNTPPSISLTSPVTAASFVSLATVNLAADVTDSDGTVTKVDFYRGGTLIATTTAAPYAFTWTNVQPGNYNITARVTDNLGGVTTSNAAAITVTNPITVAMVPLVPNKFRPPAAITLTANATDTNGTISKVDFYSGTTLLGTAVSEPYTFSWNDVPTGKYTITAKAFDSQGLSKTSSGIGITVNALPAVTLTAPTANASYTAPAAVTLTADATDIDGSVAKVQFYSGSTLLGAVTSAPYSFTWPNVAIGNYTVTARVTDNLGQVITSTAVPIKVIANANPSTVLLTPINNASIIAPATINLTANATPAAGNSIRQVDYFNGANLIGTSTTAPYSANWIDVTAGTYAITARATDNLGQIGNSTAANVTVVPNQAPIVSVTATPDNTMSPATITLAATASDKDGSIAKVEFINGATVLATVTQAPYTYTWTNVGAGSYTVTARATDNANLATTSNPIAVTVMGSVAQVYFIHSDQINTPRVITDSNGNAVWKWESDPFGAALPNENPSNLGVFTYNHRFPGQYYDRETGLHQNYFRDYDPSTGRYVQSDPIGLRGGINRYTYVGGNPISFIDPNGEFLQLPAGAAVGAVFGAMGNGFTSWTNGNGFWNKDALTNGAIGGAVGGLLATAGAPSIGGAVGAGITDALNQGAKISEPSTWCKVDTTQLALVALAGGAMGNFAPATLSPALNTAVNQAASIGVGGFIGNLIDFAKSLR